MDEDDIRVPLFLITGFLESGKTTFLSSTIGQDYFQIEGPTLLINCEDGERGYNADHIKRHFNTDYVEIGEQEEFTPEALKKLEEKYHPERVLLEYNPLWGVKNLEEMELPDGWGILQEIVIVDASTFQIYMNNMKSLFVDMTRNAELVIFNRSDQNLPLANFRRSIKVNNPACQVMFEDRSGNITDIFEDSVPYDLDSDVIDIEDVDYGIFYVDMRENPDRYRGKTVRFKGRVLKSQNKDADYFVPGRQAMTCCAADLQFIGFICESAFAPKLKMGSWVDLTADVGWKYEEAYGEEGPVLRARSIKNTTAPDPDIVYFT